jgi:transposase
MASAQKGAAKERRRIVFVDETGCYLLPSVVRTYAPRGQTPVLREQATRDHLSAISGVTPEGHLFVQAQDHAFSGAEAAAFLRHLTRHLSTRLLVIWDGNPIHRSKEVQAFLASEAGKDVHLERLPGYAPDLNPDEGVWQLLKGVELKNVTCLHLGHLFHEFWKAVKRLRQKPWLLRACSLEPGLV